MENATKRVAIDPRTTRGHHWRRAGCGAFWLAAAVFTVVAIPLAKAAEPELFSTNTHDTSAHGYAIPGTGLWLGGYLNIGGFVPNSGPASLKLSDVGLLARYEVTPSISLFNEVDLEDSVGLEDGEGVIHESKFLLLERLYSDWSVNPEFTIRVGKFLTPFGLWNVIRRAPLTWTVERPLATQSAFPEHTTGLGLLYQTTRQGWTVDGIAYGQATDELVRGASDTSATALGGGRVSVSHSIGPAYGALGFSVDTFRNRDTRRWEDAYGTDVALTVSDHEFMGEFAYSHVREVNAAREWGLYVQDVFPLYGNLYGVGRFEHSDSRQPPSVNGVLIGLHWQPLWYLVVKADYQFADRRHFDVDGDSDLERGFLASVVLFF